jgi:hypothetical protein
MIYLVYEISYGNVICHLPTVKAIHGFSAKETVRYHGDKMKRRKFLHTQYRNGFSLQAARRKHENTTDIQGEYLIIPNAGSIRQLFWQVSQAARSKLK